MIIAEHQVSSTAPPEAFFAKWADVRTWPEWNTDIEWIRQDGPFAAGTVGKLKPKGGPAVKYTITRLTDTEYVDVTRLPGARLTFTHTLTRDGERTTVANRIELHGPMRWLWHKIMGPGLAASLPADLNNLAAAAEAVAAEPKP